MLHWYSKVTIILRKRKIGEETIIVRWREYKKLCDYYFSCLICIYETKYLILSSLNNVPKHLST